MDALLELRRVSKQFPGHRAVDDVSLAIARGTFFSLLGPSGCGKTTTLRLVAGFETPSAGEIWLNGARIDQAPPYQRIATRAFRNKPLFPHFHFKAKLYSALVRTGP